MSQHHNAPHSQEVASHNPLKAAAVTVTYSPLCTIEQWAEMCGLSVGTVQKHVERAIIPSIKLGKRRLVNVEAIRIKAAELAAQYVL